MTRAGTRNCFALFAAALVLFPAVPGLTAETPAPEERDNEDQGYDEAEHAFLGGPDPPCMLPCVLVLCVLFAAAILVALAVGLVLTGVVLVCVLMLAGGCLVLAVWCAWQGMWLAAVLALLPVILAMWAVAAKKRTNRGASRDEPPEDPANG